MRKRALWFMWILCTAILVCVTAYGGYRYFGAVHFEQDLKNIDENVTVDETRYHVSNDVVEGPGGARPEAAVAEKARGMAYALTTARRSPSFDLEGTDPAKLRSAANELEASLARFIQSQTSDDNKRLFSVLYPISFIRSLADLEESRQQFIASGSDIDERSYEAKLSATVAAGTHDVAAFKSAYDSVGNRHFRLFSGVVTGDAIDKELDNIAGGFRRVQETETRRTKCYDGEMSSCEQSDISVDLSAASSTPSSAPVTDTVKEVIAQWDATKIAAGGQLIEMPSSLCAKSLPAPSFFLLNDDIRAVQLRFVGDQYFFVYGTQYHSKFFENLDLNYVLNNPMTYYNCLEIGHDLSQAETLVKLARILNISGDLIRESDVLSRFRSSFEQAQGGGLKDLLPYYLMLKDHSASFDMTVADIARISETDQNQLAAGLPMQLTAPFLFSAKSGFYALFLAYNPSAGSLPFNMYEQDGTGGVLARMTKWSDIREDVSPQKVQHDMAVMVSYHADPKSIAYAVPPPYKPPPPPALPDGAKEYRNTSYFFSLYYPQALAVSESKGPGNSLTVTFKDQAKNEGFQIFVIPYGQPKITQERFLLDEPSGVMQQPVDITVDGVAATKFLSTNQAMGATREIWFLHGGLLYEVTAPQPLDGWLTGIMKTWKYL